ncbi:hypothetical protein QBC46DRAFT_355624 [Diplogelasinospora grovesii]|uniref:Uncharacterized protein n=1 Tax=Diplogelasinospora grovesii TaxID=303347 RepID=A0AAN6N3Z8_9PEZI|nr:hypothetical protein QBC46DRAFT_355624 [Diplogelasinospora grovesii]
MPSLPLKVQLGIRDHWTKEDGELQTSLKKLAELVGHEVVIDPEWQLLVNELDAFYPDKGNMVAIIAVGVWVWVKSIMELLEDTAHEEWTDTLLEKAPSRVRLILEVGKTDKTATSWSDHRGGFVITLPKKHIFQPAELAPVFRGDLITCWSPPPPKPSLPSRSAAAAVATDDWADVEMDQSTGAVQVVDIPQPAISAATTTATAAPKPKVEYLPSLASLPRPDELFLRPPYYLVLTTNGHAKIEIQGSHSPSLQLLSDYLGRWVRVNHQDTRNPSAVQITLHQSALGLGEMFDRLTLSTEDTKYTDRFRVTAPMVVAIIEGVLGYEMIGTTHGEWKFRRDTEFKTL